MTGPTRERGFTLIELLVTVTIAAILLIIAVPSLSDFMKRNAVTTQSNAFLGALRMARSTAVTRSTLVSICPSTTAADATPTCSTTNTFDTGWLIYTSKVAGKVFSTGDELIRVSTVVSNASIQAPTTIGVVTFDPRGSSTKGAVSFLICAKAASDAVGKSSLRAGGRRIDVQSGGRSGIAPLATSSTDSDALAYCTAA